MQLHELQPLYPNKSRRRLGRGYTRGHKSGKGQKGQRSRAGRSIRPAERDLIQRMPKLRGWKNKTSVYKKDTKRVKARPAIKK